jgi:hypothetical protein
MAQPTIADYVRVITELFEEFDNQRGYRDRRGRPVTYKDKAFIVFFMMMQFRGIFKFKTQHRWLKNHEEELEKLGWTTVPDRTTLSRRYKKLYQTIQEFTAYLGRIGFEFDSAFKSEHLYEDKSLFKAQGSVWHQKDRKAGRIPDKLRNLDKDATWSKSGHHGWVYGYGLHITCNEAGYPVLVQVETATVSEATVIEQKEDQIIETLNPKTVSGDNSYAQATRIKRWLKKGVVLLTPAYKWKNSKPAKVYKEFIKQPSQAKLLRQRRTAIEPVFDLIAKLIGATGKQKQLPIQGLRNVRTCLALATLTLQFAMLVNSMWGLPLRNISHIRSVFT